MTPEDINRERQHEYRERRRLALVFERVGLRGDLTAEARALLRDLADRVERGDDAGVLPEEDGYAVPQWGRNLAEAGDRATPVPGG